jgi:Family of unknown function (DUF6441)
MKLATTMGRSLQADMQAELRDTERAVTSGTRDAGRGLQTELRRQVTSAGLGQRLANSWRDQHYPNQKLDAASSVYTMAPQIIRAFDEGAVIRSRRGRLLAIPTGNAPRKGTDGMRLRQVAIELLAGRAETVPNGGISAGSCHSAPHTATAVRSMQFSATRAFQWLRNGGS